MLHAFRIAEFGADASNCEGGVRLLGRVGLVGEKLARAETVWIRLLGAIRVDKPGGPIGVGLGSSAYVAKLFQFSGRPFQRLGECVAGLEQRLSELEAIVLALQL